MNKISLKFFILIAAALLKTPFSVVVVVELCCVSHSEGILPVLDTLVLEMPEFCDDVGDRVFSVHLVVPCAYIDCLVGGLLLSHHQDEVVLLQLGVPDLLVHGVAGIDVVLCLEPCVVELLLHLEEGTQVIVFL